MKEMAIKENPFLTRLDYQRALEDMIAPLREAILADDYPGLNLGSSGAVYDRTRAEMEALVRPLWGLAPYWRVCPDDPLRAAYVEKVIAGTDPEHAFYWGRITDYDQYIVEAAALSLTLLLQKNAFGQRCRRRTSES